MELDRVSHRSGDGNDTLGTLTQIQDGHAKVRRHETRDHSANVEQGNRRAPRLTTQRYERHGDTAMALAAPLPPSVMHSPEPLRARD